MLFFRPTSRCNCNLQPGKLSQHNRRKRDLSGVCKKDGKVRAQMIHTKETDKGAFNDCNCAVIADGVSALLFLCPCQPVIAASQGCVCQFVLPMDQLVYSQRQVCQNKGEISV